MSGTETDMGKGRLVGRVCRQTALHSLTRSFIIFFEKVT